MNQVLFRVEESVDLLSNRVWDLFLLRIDGKSHKGKLESFRAPMEVRERGHLVTFGQSERLSKEEDHCEGEGEV
jgi:hypothetical protein